MDVGLGMLCRREEQHQTQVRWYLVVPGSSCTSAFFLCFFLALYALVLGVTNWNPVTTETLLHSCAAHGGSEQQASSLAETSSQAETSSCSRLVLTVL